jgi:hypothetical protein
VNSNPESPTRKGTFYKNFVSFLPGKGDENDELAALAFAGFQRVLPSPLN